MYQIEEFPNFPLCASFNLINVMLDCRLLDYLFSRAIIKTMQNKLLKKLVAAVTTIVIVDLYLRSVVIK